MFETDFNSKMRELLHPFAKSFKQVYVREYNKDYRNEMNIYFNMKITNFKFEKTQFVIFIKAYPLFASNSVDFTKQNRLKEGQLIILADREFTKILTGAVCFVDGKCDETFRKNHYVEFVIVPEKNSHKPFISSLNSIITLAKLS